jgi:tetratricopeptide (TPR) repeat protein
MKKGDMEKANQHYQRAAKLAPQDIEISKMVKDVSAQITAHSYTTANSSRDLIRDKEKAKELEEDQAVLRTEEDIQRAIERCKKRIAEDPGSKKDLRRLAELLQKLNQFDESLEVLKKLLEIDPTNFDIKCKLGDCRIAKIAENLRVLRENLKKSPQNDAMKQKLQKALQEKNEIEIQEYTLRLQTQPTNSELRFKLGSALFQAKKFDEAISNFQQALQDPRNKVSAYNYIGQAFVNKQEYDLAVEQYKTALSLVSPTEMQHREIKYNLGLAYELANKPTEAVEVFKEICTVDIGYKDVQARLKKLKVS